MRGDQHADVHASGFVSADAFDFAFFENAKKFGLHGDRHIADFVEKKSSAVGLLEFSGVFGGGSSERAFFVAEEFGLDQFSRDGSAIQGDESVFVARRFFVDGAGDELFASTGFAEDTNAGLTGGNAVDLRAQLFHSWAFTDQFVLTETMAEFAIFVLEAREAESIVDGDEQLVGGKGLFEKIERTQFCGANGHFNIGLAGDEDYRSFYSSGFEILQKIETAFSGHDDIGKDQVERFGAEKFDGASGIVADRGLVSGQTESTRERGESVGVVVNEKKVSFSRQALRPFIACVIA
jgi:hypothetical protein